MGTGYATIVKGEEDEKRVIKLFTETGITVSDDRKVIDRDHKYEVYSEPSKRNRTLYVRYPWRI